MPVMIPAAGHSSSYMPSAASGATSSSALPGSSKSVDPVARQQLAARDVSLTRTFRPAERCGGQLAAQLLDKLQMRLTVGGR